MRAAYEWLDTLVQLDACHLGSVVIDGEGDAWQLVEDEGDDGARVWRTGAGDAYALGWHATSPVLLDECERLLLVWRGGAA